MGESIVHGMVQDTEEYKSLVGETAEDASQHVQDSVSGNSLTLQFEKTDMWFVVSVFQLILLVMIYVKLSQV